MTATREVAIDDVDMETLDMPELDIDAMFTRQHERWIDVLVLAGLHDLADELRRELRERDAK